MEALPGVVLAYALCLHNFEQPAGHSAAPVVAYKQPLKFVPFCVPIDYRRTNCRRGETNQFQTLFELARPISSQYR
jgi:hypothetical protein